MKKEWKSFRITLLLYVAILAIPIGVWFNYKLYDDLRQTAYTISHIMKIQEGLLLITSTPPNEKRAQKLAHINETVEKAGLWIETHQNDPDYVGGKSLKIQYNDTYTCWKNIYTHTATIKRVESQCLKKTHSLIFTLERMYILKQSRFERMLFIGSALLLLVLLLTVYFIRLYLYHQSKEHAIYNLESNLYNRKFLEETFRRKCANVKRYNKTLSVLHIQIPQLHPKESSLAPKEQTKMLHSISKTLWHLTRDSDIACHVEEDTFVILMPETTKEQSKIVEERIRESLNKIFSHPFNMKCKTCEASDEESCEVAFEMCIG